MQKSRPTDRHAQHVTYIHCKTTYMLCVEVNFDCVALQNALKKNTQSQMREEKINLTKQKREMRNKPNDNITWTAYVCTSLECDIEILFINSQFIMITNHWLFAIVAVTKLGKN